MQHSCLSLISISWFRQFSQAIDIQKGNLWTWKYGPLKTSVPEFTSRPLYFHEHSWGLAWWIYAPIKSWTSLIRTKCLSNLSQILNFSSKQFFDQGNSTVSTRICLDSVLIPNPENWHAMHFNWSKFTHSTLQYKIFCTGSRFQFAFSDWHCYFLLLDKIEVCCDNLLFSGTHWVGLLKDRLLTYYHFCFQNITFRLQSWI